MIAASLNAKISNPVTSTLDTKATRTPAADADLIWEWVNIWTDPISLTLDTSQSGGGFHLLCLEDVGDGGSVTVLDVEVRAMSPAREASVSTTAATDNGKRQQEDTPSRSFRDNNNKKKRKKAAATNVADVFHYAV
ncbi:hypothetical protein Gpo141_00013819 [Globisporangium polare]